MKTKILSLFVALIIAIPAFASIAVSPTKVEINANKIKSNYATATIEVRGDSKQPIRFRVYPGYFTISNTSEMIIKEKSDDPHDLSKKIRYVPSEFTVLPGKTQKLRLNIANIRTLPDGESRAVLFLEDVNAKEYMVPNNLGIGAQLIIKTRAGIPVYVEKGDTTKVFEVESFNVSKGKDGQYSEIKLLSKGNTKIRYNCKMQIVKDKKLLKEYTIPGRVVGENNFYISKEKIDTSGIKERGEYTLRAVFSYTDCDGKMKTLKSETKINIQGEI